MVDEKKNKKAFRLIKRFFGLLIFGVLLAIFQEYNPFKRAINDFDVVMYVDKIQSKLPVKADDILTFTSIALANRTIEHSYEVVNEKEDLFNLEGQENTLRIYSCFSEESDNILRVLEAGYDKKYVYVNEDGKLIGSFVISRDVCSGFGSRDADGLGHYLSDELNKLLPIQNSETSWMVESRYENNTLRIANLEQGVTKEGVDMAYFADEFQELYRQYSCKGPDVWSLLYQGAKVEYNFFDVNEELFGTFTFDAEKCTDIREALRETLR